MRTAIFCPCIIIVSLFTGVTALTSCKSQQFGEKQLYVIFRFDDYSAKGSTDMELRIIDAFRKNGASITFGVIPFVTAGDVHEPSHQDVVPLTLMKADILKTAFKEGIIDIALHGYSHQAIGAMKWTEFSGLDYNRQVERLTEGKKFIEQIIDDQVTTFIPPWNQYDLNTLRALKEVGFSTISAAVGGEATEDSMLNFLPATCNLIQLRNAIKAARRSSDTQPVILVLFHEYDFREIAEKQGYITYKEFSDLLRWLKSQEDIRLLSISQAANVINDLSASRAKLNNWIYSLSSLMPLNLAIGHTNRYADSIKLIIILWLYLGTCYLAIFSILAFTSFIIGYFVFPISKLITKICKYVSIIVSIIIPIYAFRDMSIHAKGLTVSAGAIGSLFGIWLCFLYLKKKKLFAKSRIKAEKSIGLILWIGKVKNSVNNKR